MATRPLTEHERAVLLHVLAAPVAGADALRVQAAHAQAEGDGGPSLTLTVPNSVPRAAVADGPWPVTAHVYGGAEYLGELLLWVKEGRLDAFEYAWVTDDPPTALPDPSSIRVSPRS